MDVPIAFDLFRMIYLLLNWKYTLNKISLYMLIDYLSNRKQTTKIDSSFSD